MTDRFMSMFESCMSIGLLGQASVSYRSIEWPYSALCPSRDGKKLLSQTIGPNWIRSLICCRCIRIVNKYTTEKSTHQNRLSWDTISTLSFIVQKGFLQRICMFYLLISGMYRIEVGLLCGLYKLGQPG